MVKHVLMALLGGALWAPLWGAPAPEAPKSLRQRLAEKLEQDKTEVKLKLPTAGVRAAAPSRAASAPAAKAATWGYAGDGAPDRWGELSPDYRLCATGSRQAPIDLRDTLRVDLEPIQFEYPETGFSVLDNGRAIQVDLEPGRGLSVTQRRYELKQLVFRMPSEFRINGSGFDMEVQAWHQDSEGRRAVLSILLTRGADQPQIQQVLNNLPLEKRQVQTAADRLDLSALLPTERAYFTFMGSQTTPPCTEGVLWLVMRKPQSISPQQLDIFSKLYPMNARPVQPVGGRLIKESF